MADSAAYHEYYRKSVQPFIDLCRKTEETKYIVSKSELDLDRSALLQADATEKAFKRQGELITAASYCRKPDSRALMAFVSPISAVIMQAERKVHFCALA